MTSENKTRPVEFEPIMTRKRWILDLTAMVLSISVGFLTGYSLAANCVA